MVVHIPNNHYGVDHFFLFAFFFGGCGWVVSLVKGAIIETSSVESRRDLGL